MNIDIPNSVTSIGESSFRSCISLTTMNIPASVIYIGDCAFYDDAVLISLVRDPSKTIFYGNDWNRNCPCCNMNEVACSHSLMSTQSGLDALTNRLKVSKPGHLQNDRLFTHRLPKLGSSNYPRAEFTYYPSVNLCYMQSISTANWGTTCLGLGAYLAVVLNENQEV